MSHERHFTTRRGFIGAMGFGALGLYATWAAYGASPLPFAASAESGADPHAGHAAPSSHSGHADDPAFSEPHGASSLSPQEFERRHADFLMQSRQADGSIRPMAGTSGGVGHDHAALVEPMSMADMPGMSHSGHDMHVGPGSADTLAHGGHDHGASDGEPVEVYLAASRFAFEPDDLRLEVGRPYRFHMMATDVAHGASIAFGQASRIVRLRTDTVTTLDLTFREAGRYLVYCTVYCGPGHDGMHGSITVV